jgi:glycosyltransferase involved in cell wall biosynthesis
MKQPAISVIVPVYNAEAFLSRCVDSLLSQTLANIEIILVDDGSTDSSKTLCEQYAVEDNRVRVVSQPNRGVAMARQAGVDVASGIYSIHVDPDDWIEHTMLEEMYTKAIEEDADMVICDFMVDFADRNYVASQKVGKCEPNDCLTRMMYGKIHGSLCNKLIRTDLYDRYKIRFFDGINYCEDYFTCVQLFIQGVKIAYIPKAFYHYDQVLNNNSATRRYTKETLQTQFRFYGKLCEILNGRQKKALSHVISVIAFDSYYNDIFSSAEFSSIFGKYRKDFLKSKFKLKRRVALYLAALGLMKCARKVHK